MTIKTSAPIILVVDNNPHDLTLISAMLGKGDGLEFDLRSAANGHEALDILEDTAPDLVLLDINIPGMSSFDVCLKIRSSAKTMHIPVVFLTARDETDNILQGFRAGGSDYVVKPFQPQELLARVRVQLELHWTRLETSRLSDELCQLKNELQQFTNTDGLLRIANRRIFDETLSREWQRAIRSNQPVSLMFIDVDHFRLYNDHYGHLAGDECLKRIAAALGRGVRRAADMLARYSGEKFAVILPATDLPSACLVADSIHASLREEGILHGFSAVSDFVTVSIGVANGEPKIGSLPEALLRRADGALYAAKQQGRSRTCLYDENDWSD